MSKELPATSKRSFDTLKLSVDEIDCTEDFEQLAPEWRNLECHAATPFASYDWAAAWWKHFRENKWSVEDCMAVKAFRYNHELVAVAPMMLTRRPARGPYCVRQMHFFGADPNVTELRGLVAHPAFKVPAYRALCEHLLLTASRWDLAIVSGVPADAGIASSAVERALGGEFVREIPEYLLRLPSTWSELKRNLPRNIKESLRKCYNAPARAGLELSFEVQHGSADMEQLLAPFFRLHEARARLENTVVHGNVFGSQLSRAFLIDVCSRFAARDCFRLFVLRAGERVVSVRIGFVVGDTLYLYFSGFDPEFGKYSVASRVLAEAIQHAIEQGFKLLHLSAGADRSKLRWRPEELVHQEFRFTSPHARSRLARGVYQGAARLAASGPLAYMTQRYLMRRAPTAE